MLFLDVTKNCDALRLFTERSSRAQQRPRVGSREQAFIRHRCEDKAFRADERALGSKSDTERGAIRSRENLHAQWKINRTAHFAGTSRDCCDGGGSTIAPLARSRRKIEALVRGG